MKKISSIENEDTVEPLIYNLPIMEEDNRYSIMGWKFDWTPIYGKLMERRV